MSMFARSDKTNEGAPAAVPGRDEARNDVKRAPPMPARRCRR